MEHTSIAAAPRPGGTAPCLPIGRPISECTQNAHLPNIERQDLGCGGSAPDLSGRVVVDLKQMNALLKSTRIATSTVEMEVSYFDLFTQICTRRLCRRALKLGERKFHRCDAEARLTGARRERGQASEQPAARAKRAQVENEERAVADGVARQDAEREAGVERMDAEIERRLDRTPEVILATHTLPRTRCRQVR